MAIAGERVSRRDYKNLIHKKAAEQERAAVGRRETISFERVREALWQLIPDGNDPITVDWKNDLILAQASALQQRAEEEGLSEKMVLRSIGEVEKNINLRARTESRYEHTENLHDELQAAGKAWVKKTFIQLKYKCTESLAIIGQGPAKTEAARKKQIVAEVGAMHTGGAALQELLQGSLENQIAHNRLERYKRIGGTQFTGVIDEYREGKITDRELTDNENYTRGLDRIAASLEIDEPFELGEPPVVIENLTEPQKEAIRRHIRFVLRSEILQLSLVTDNSRVHRLAGLDSGNREYMTQCITGISTSGTVWKFLSPVVGKAVVGGTFGAFLASGGIAPAIAVGVIGAAAGAVRGSIRHRQIVRQRRVDIALDRFRNDDAVRSPEQLMGIITQNMEIAQRAVDTGTPPPQHIITNLYVAILEATNRLQSSLTSDQQYITINPENPFANREQLHDTIENAHALLEQMIETLPDAQQTKMREDLKKSAKNKKKEFAGKKERLENLVSGDKEEYVMNSALTSGVAASVASIAMHVIHGMDISRGLDAPALGYTQRPDDVIDILSDHSGMSRHATLRSVEVLELIGGVLAAKKGIDSLAAEHWYTGPTDVGTPRSAATRGPMEDITMERVQGHADVHEAMEHLETGDAIIERVAELQAELTGYSGYIADWYDGDLQTLNRSNRMENEWHHHLADLDTILHNAQALPQEAQLTPVGAGGETLSARIALFGLRVAEAHRTFAETGLTRMERAVVNVHRCITDEISEALPPDQPQLDLRRRTLIGYRDFIRYLREQLDTLEEHIQYFQQARDITPLRAQVDAIENALENHIQFVNDEIQKLEMAGNTHLQELNDRLQDLTRGQQALEADIHEVLRRLHDQFTQDRDLTVPTLKLALTKFHTFTTNHRHQLNGFLQNSIPDVADRAIPLLGGSTIDQRAQDILHSITNGEQQFLQLCGETIEQHCGEWRDQVYKMHEQQIQPIVDDKNFTPTERQQRLGIQRLNLGRQQQRIHEWRTFTTNHPETRAAATGALDAYATVVQGAIYQIDSFWRDDTERDAWKDTLDDATLKTEVDSIIAAVNGVNSLDDPRAIETLKVSIKEPRKQLRRAIEEIKAQPAKRLEEHERLAAYEATNVAFAVAINQLNEKIGNFTLAIIAEVNTALNDLHLDPTTLTPENATPEIMALIDENNPIRKQIKKIQTGVRLFMHAPEPPVRGSFLTRAQLLTPHRALEFRMDNLLEQIDAYTTPEDELQDNVQEQQQKIQAAFGQPFIDLLSREIGNDPLQTQQLVQERILEEFSYDAHLRLAATPDERTTQVLGPSAQQRTARMELIVERAVQSEPFIFRPSAEAVLPEPAQYALHAFRHKTLDQLEELVGEETAIQIGSELLTQLGTDIETAIADANTVLDILEHKKEQFRGRNINQLHDFLQRTYGLERATPARIQEFVSTVVNYAPTIPDPTDSTKQIKNQPLFRLLKPSKQQP